MPPFKSGLLKRKAITSSSNVDTNKVTSDGEVSISSSIEEELIPGEINNEEDATDSENEEENSAASDAEQDEVLYQDAAHATLADDEEAGADGDGDDSSDLEDSDASDSDAEASDNIGEDENNDAEDETEDDEVEDSDSDAESGIGQTISSSESHDKPQAKNAKQKKPVKSKGDTKIKQIKHMISKEDSKTSIDRLAESIQNTNVTPVVQKDEYESGDSSDEEERRNTVGNVPMWWYDEYPHVGYDLAGRKLIKPPQRDHIDDFLKKCEDPEFWRTVRDPATGQDVLLSKQDLELIHRIRQGHVPNPDHDEYKPWVEWFSREVLATPVRAFPEHKRSFLPARGEQKHVARLVHALRMGWLKTRKELAAERRKRKEKNFYNLWGSSPEEEERLRGVHRHIPAPRRALPHHAESYNPPPEYLLDHKEMKEWNKLAETPWKRKYTFLPSVHSSLRSVPAYSRYIRERFLRCLDLYLAPRAIKMRLTISAEDLVPRLPSPRDLQPFPTAEALRFTGHTQLVRSVDFDPSGQYIVSGSDDNTLKVWECSSGRCLRTVEFACGVSRVCWIPVAGLSLVGAAAGSRLLLLNPGADIGCHRVAADTDALLEEPPPKHDVHMDERTAACVSWDVVTAEEWARGVRLAITHFKPITSVCWHARGDYLCVTLADAASRAVVVHQVSRRRSQLPLARSKGLVQTALFHPTKPILFVATQRCVRMYDLAKQELVRKLQAGAQCISCLAAHPAGDNLLVGSYDRKCVWFDLELSGKPYQTLRLHGGAVRSVAFHRRYPLFASAGDDTRIVVSHGMVYNDLLQNPLLVPLKQLTGGARAGSLCVLQVAWHPTQPWLLAAGADSVLRLYS